ncbi:MAG: rRNA maturation RNase YbeY [Xanthomonadaceae bacterium]|jgi:probable rRNA maturation factor|nr:rRNA maturation RNase YbeY [Xanthomonadaceae bacterium]
MSGSTIRLQVAVSYGVPRRGLPAASSFRKWATATLSGHLPEAELAIRIVDSEEGRALNHRYRGKDYPTNVLSFPAELPEDVTIPLLGDLALCAPVIADEATQQHKPLNAHYAHLTVHGLLHLLGWDHRTPPEAETMEQRERDILASLGIPDPYLEY